MDEVNIPAVIHSPRIAKCRVLVSTLVLLGTAFVSAPLAAAPEKNSGELADPIPTGQRVFTCGHSFHVWVPGIVADLCKKADIPNHVQIGISSIGGSRVIQHWDIAEEKNKAKQALKTGKVDVLTLSPIFLPDEGIENFTTLALEHNKDIRIVVQPIWLRWDIYEPTMKRPKKVDHNAITGEELRKRHAVYFKSMDEHIRELNKKYGKTVLFVVPAPQAVIALREKIIAGQAPGLKMQENLFTDELGHGTAPLKALVGYCNFAVIYRRSPVGLPVPEILKQAKLGDNEKKLNRLLQELAWEAVRQHPLSGVLLNSRAPAEEKPAKKTAPVRAETQTVIDSDFSKGDFAALGWKVKGNWDVFSYPRQTPNNPGPVARFAANKPNDGSLIKTFPEVKNPKKLTLSLDYGWGWGDADQGADSVSFMLLDAKDNGYSFEVHRCKAKWAVQWAKVVNSSPAKDKTWASEEIDATHTSVRNGGGLSRMTIVREADGTWSISNKDWNKGGGARVKFIDTTTNSFSQLVLLGTKNFDDQVYNKIVLSLPPAAKASPATAIPVTRFLNSIGVDSTFPDRGQPLSKTIQMLKYGGFRWVRGGIEGLTSRGPTTVQTYLDLHKQTGVQFSWGLVSGGTDLKKLLESARPLAKADALLAFEGNNEPNNWGVTYQDEQGGGRAPSWLAVAKLQRDLYKEVKSDPVLKKYPVWSISEGGAEVDNVGLQFLTIPRGSRMLMPEGTKYADYANVHNYIYHPGSPGLADNKTWNAADPTSTCKVDGLYGNYGVTWAKHFRGYSEDELLTLPRVTTETGCTIAGPITEDIQALNLLSMYLDQFKRGWSYTAVYLLRDRTDESGNQSFGFFKPDYTPRKAAVYLHNLTTILADQGELDKPGQLNYSLSEQPATVHEMLLQKSDGTFELIVWSERLKGADEVTVHLGRAYPAVKVYDPTIGTEPIQTPGRVASLKLTLSDHPLIIAIAQK